MLAASAARERGACELRGPSCCGGGAGRRNILGIAGLYRRDILFTEAPAPPSEDPDGNSEKGENDGDRKESATHHANHPKQLQLLG